MKRQSRLMDNRVRGDGDSFSDPFSPEHPDKEKTIKKIRIPKNTRSCTGTFSLYLPLVFSEFAQQSSEIVISSIFRFKPEIQG
jgi:hypothetical protein